VNRDRGQAAVELALTLPVWCLLLTAVVQVAVVARDRLAVQLAAREGARAAVVADDLGVAAVAARAAVSLSPIIVDAVSDRRGVTVTVTHVDRTDVPLIGALLPDVTVSATATMAWEPP